jgi:hypothetical protein
MNNKKESMDINEEFLNLFMDDIKSKKKEKKRKSKKSKKIIKETKYVELNKNTFKDDILVFIEQSEIVDIKKVLNIIDKLKK